MIRVFLVEDEFVIREGIKKNINWNENGYEFCGDAADGELAYPLILKCKPDIVITDIKMPFMNGLELSRLIKKELPDTEIIILSGYEEFEYAKEAISIGVAEYLLKPVTGEELLNNLNIISDKIREKKQEKALYAQYRREIEEGFVKEKRELFDELIKNNGSVSKLIAKAGKLGIDITAVCYNILLLDYSIENQRKYEYSKELIKIDEEIEKLAEDFGIILFERDIEGKAFLIMGDNQEELNSKINGLINTLENLFANFSKVRYFGGLGSIALRLGELSNSFEHAGRAFAHRYFNSGSSIITADELDNSNVYAKTSFNLNDVSPEQINRNRILDFLKQGDIDETGYFVEEFFKNVASGAAGSTIFRQYLVVDAFFAVSEFLRSIQQDVTQITAIAEDGKVFESVSASIEYVTEIISTAITLRDSIASNRYGSIVEQVTEYIAKYYTNEDLSISEIASTLNFSPNHLSMIFRNQTGQTIVKFLTDYRLKQAKQLLKCTSLRSSEIAVKVGYKDPHYFSYLFKKTLGMTPTQYREG